MDLVGQLQQNNREYQQYVDSLLEWESTTKKKSQPSSAPQSKSQPAGKENVIAKPQSNPVKAIAEAEEDLPPALEKTRIRSGDYRAWDKFNVDQALQDLDRPDQNHDSLLLECTRLKDEGNGQFKQSKYKEALKLYSDGLELLMGLRVLSGELKRIKATLLFNRSFCLLKMHKFAESLQDADEGLKLDSRNVKALWRKSVALVRLRRFKEARECLNAAIVIEPANERVKADLQWLKTVLDTNNVKYIKVDRVASINELKIDTVEPKKSEPVEQPVAAPKKSKGVKMIIEEVEDVPSLNVQHESAPVKNDLEMDEIKATVTEKVHYAAPADIGVKAPLSAIDFIRDWKIVERQGRESINEYILSIAPQAFSTYLRPSIEPQHFSAIIQALVSLFDSSRLPKNQVVDYLTNLAMVQRFDMNLMFASKQIKLDVTALFDKLNEPSVRSKYKC